MYRDTRENELSAPSENELSKLFHEESFTKLCELFSNFEFSLISTSFVSLSEHESSHRTVSVGIQTFVWQCIED